MADFISDEDMMKLESKAKGVQTKSPDFISDEDMGKMETPSRELGGLLSQSISELANEPMKLPGQVMDPNQFVPGLMAGLKKIDEYTGAPIRKFTTGLITGKPQETAPSGAEQAAMMGVPTTTYGERYGVPSYMGGNVSPADVAGLGLEVVQDPLVLGQGLLKVGGKLAPIIAESPITKTIQNIKQGATELKPNVDEINQAMEALSAQTGKGAVEPTVGMLSREPLVQGMESSLSQSPTYAGSLVRQKTQPVYNLLQQSGENLFENVPKVQPSDVGLEFKKGLRSEIESRVKPISEAYDKIRDSTQFIDVNPQSLQRVSNNIINSEPFKSSPGYGSANVTANDLLNVKNVDELKSLRSNVGRRLQDPNLSGAEQATLNMMYGKLSKLEQNTIMREAIKQARNGAQGEQIGSQLVKELKQANTDFRGVMQDLGVLGEETGISKKVNNIDNFLDKVDKIPDEKIIDTFFRTKNRQSLLNLEKLNPEGYESLKQAKLSLIKEDSLTKGELDPSKLVRNLKDMEHDTKVLLFGDQGADNLNHMKNVINSLPTKMGPSGTPQGWEFVNIFSPKGLMNEFSRMAQYRTLQGKISETPKQPLNIDYSKVPIVKGLLGRQSEQK